MRFLFYPFLERSAIKKMDDQLKILIKATLADNTQKSINDQLKKLKFDPIKVKIDVDKNSIKEAIKAAKGSTEDKNSPKVKVFDVDKLEEDGRKFYISATKIIDRVKKDYKSMGDVDVTNIFKNEKEQIQSFTVAVTKANGVIEKFNFNKAKLESSDWKSTQSGFVQTSSVGTDKLLGGDLEKRLNTLNRLDNRLKDIRQKAFDLNNAITNPTQVDTLNKKYQEIADALDVVRKSGNAFSQEQQRNIGNMIADVERLRKEYQKTNPKTGGTESLDSTLKKLNNYQKKLADIQQSAFSLAHPIETPEHQAELSEQYLKIDQAINKVKESGKAMSVQQQMEIDNMISDAERLRRAYVEIEKPASALDLKPLSDSAAELKSTLSVFEKQWKNTGLLTDDLKAKVDALKDMPIDDRQSLNKFRSQLKLTVNEARKLRLAMTEFDAETAKKTAFERLSIFLRDNPKASKAAKYEIDNLFASIKTMDSTIAQSKWNKKFREFTLSIDEMGKRGATVFGTLTKNMSKFFGWLLSSGAVMSAIATLKNMVNTVISLDKALVNLQMATGGSRSNIKELLNTYTELGKRLGATTEEVATAGNTWLRQGMSIADTNKMIENSMILSKIGMLSSAEATEYLTSSMKGYGVAVEDTIKIVDMLSAVDLKSATDAGGLALAMSRTAASAKVAGVEMSKLIGYIATVSEVTQKEASSIGESFNFGAAAA